MRVFRFRAVSTIFFILAVILIPIGWFNFGRWLGDIGILPLSSDVASMLFVVCTLIFAMLLIGHVSSAKVEITVGTDAVTIKWIGRFFLFFKKRDTTIPFSEIDTYFEWSHRYLNWLFIRKTDGKTYTINSFSLANNDYDGFVAAFRLFVRNYTNRITESAETDNSNVKTEISCIYTRYVDKMAKN